MDNTKSSLNDKKILVKDHKMIVDNRKKISLSSVEKAISSNDTSVVVDLGKSKVVVMGKGLHFMKLDLEQGVAEIGGEINSVKYVDGAQVSGFFKRIFK